MISHLCDEYFVSFYLVNYPVLFVDAAGPVTGQIVAEGFGFSNALISVALNVADQFIYSKMDFFVCFLPVTIVLPGILREYEPHSINSRSWPFPLSNSSTDSQSLDAFVGL